MKLLFFITFLSCCKTLLLSQNAPVSLCQNYEGVACNAANCLRNAKAADQLRKATVCLSSWYDGKCTKDCDSNLVLSNNIGKSLCLTTDFRIGKCNQDQNVWSFNGRYLQAYSKETNKFNNLCVGSAGEYSSNNTLFIKLKLHDSSDITNCFTTSFTGTASNVVDRRKNLEGNLKFQVFNLETSTNIEYCLDWLNPKGDNFEVILKNTTECLQFLPVHHYRKCNGGLKVQGKCLVWRYVNHCPQSCRATLMIQKKQCFDIFDNTDVANVYCENEREKVPILASSHPLEKRFCNINFCEKCQRPNAEIRNLESMDKSAKTSSSTSDLSIDECQVGSEFRFFKEEVYVLDSTPLKKVTVEKEITCFKECLENYECTFFRVRTDAVNGKKMPCELYSEIQVVRQLPDSVRMSPRLNVIGKVGFMIGARAAQINNKCKAVAFAGARFCVKSNVNSNVLINYISTITSDLPAEVCRGNKYTWYLTAKRNFEEVAEKLQQQLPINHFPRVEYETFLNNELQTSASNVYCLLENNEKKCKELDGTSVVWKYTLDKQLGRVVKFRSDREISKKNIWTFNVEKKLIDKTECFNREDYCPTVYEKSFTDSLGIDPIKRFVKSKSDTKKNWKIAHFSPGHLVAQQFSSPHGFFNFVPQGAQSNQHGCWFNAEMATRNLLLRGCKGIYEGEMVYNDDASKKRKELAELRAGKHGENYLGYSKFSSKEIKHKIPSNNEEKTQDIKIVEIRDNNLVYDYDSEGPKEISLKCLDRFRPFKMNLKFGISSGTGLCEHIIPSLEDNQIFSYSRDERKKISIITVQRAILHWLKYVLAPRAAKETKPHEDKDPPHSATDDADTPKPTPTPKLIKNIGLSLRTKDPVEISFLDIRGLATNYAGMCYSEIGRLLGGDGHLHEVMSISNDFTEAFLLSIPKEKINKVSLDLYKHCLYRDCKRKWTKKDNILRSSSIVNGNVIEECYNSNGNIVQVNSKNQDECLQFQYSSEMFGLQVDLAHNEKGVLDRSHFEKIIQSSPQNSKDIEVMKDGFMYIIPDINNPTTVEYIQDVNTKETYGKVDIKSLHGFMRTGLSELTTGFLLNKGKTHCAKYSATNGEIKMVPVATGDFNKYITLDEISNFRVYSNCHAFQSVYYNHASLENLELTNPIAVSSRTILD